MWLKNKTVIEYTKIHDIQYIIQVNTRVLDDNTRRYTIHEKFNTRSMSDSGSVYIRSFKVCRLVGK